MPYSSDDLSGFFNRVEAQNTPQGAQRAGLATDALYDQTKPVQARELFTVRPQPQPQQNQEADVSFFELPSVEVDPELAPQYEPDKKQFYQSFARGFNSRRFTGLKDYENWLKTLPGESQQIRSYMQEIGEKYMPTVAKQEWEMKQRSKAARQQIVAQVELEKIQKEERQRQGVSTVTPSEQKTLDARLKNAIAMREKAGSAKEREYFQGQIDNLMTEAQGGVAPSSMTKEEFVADYKAVKNRIPTDQQIEAAHRKGYWR